MGLASKEPTLKEVATGTFYGSYSEMSTEAFGDENWIDIRLQHALDGEEEFDTDTKRVQVTTQPLVLHRCVVLVY